MYEKDKIYQIRKLLNELEGALEAAEYIEFDKHLITSDKIGLFPSHRLFEAKQEYSRKQQLSPNLDNSITQKENTNFKTATKEENMAVLFDDGSFRDKRKGKEYRFMIDGKQKSVFGKTKEECYQKRLEFIAGKTKQKNTAGVKVQTLSEWLAHWWATYKIAHLKKDSAARSQSIINKHIIPALGATLITKLNHDKLQTFLNGFIDCPNTQKKIFDIVHGSLEKARISGKIKLNPADGLQLKRYTKKKRLALQIGQQLSVCTLLEKRSKKYSKLFMFCCCTGIRIGKILELTRKDIDFENHEILVKMKQKQGLEDIYRVPFLPELIEGLPVSGRIFPIGKKSVQDFFKRIFNELSIADITVHSFRHTFISMLRFVGVPFEYIKELAGHKTMAMTTDVYTHIIKNNGTSPVLEYLLRLKKVLNLPNVP